jgi:HEAT repeat protein
MASSNESYDNPPARGGRLRWILLGVLGGILSVIVVCVLICVGFIALIWHAFNPSDRPLEENIQIVKDNRSAEERGYAIVQIIKLGPKAEPAVPVLLDCLGDDRKFVYRVMQQFMISRKASEALVGIGGPKVLDGLCDLIRGKDNKKAARAAETLPKLKTDVEQAVPALLDAFETNKDPDVVRQVTDALVKIRGAKVVHGLGALLASADDGLVSRAATTLGKMGSDASAAVPALLDALKKGNGTPFYDEVVAALTSIGSPQIPEGVANQPDDPKVVDEVKVLQAALADGKPEVRADAAKKLGALGAKAKSAALALDKLLTDEDSQVRVEAAWALWLIVPQAKDTFAILVAGLSVPESAVQTGARAYLDQIGPKDLWAMEELVKNFQLKDKLLRLESLKAIARMGPAASKTKSYPMLVNGLLDPDEEFRKEVANTIQKIDK